MKQVAEGMCASFGLRLEQNCQDAVGNIYFDAKDVVGDWIFYSFLYVIIRKGFFVCLGRIYKDPESSDRFQVVGIRKNQKTGEGIISVYQGAGHSGVGGRHEYPYDKVFETKPFESAEQEALELVGWTRPQKEVWEGREVLAWSKERSKTERSKTSSATPGGSEDEEDEEVEEVEEPKKRKRSQATGRSKMERSRTPGGSPTERSKMERSPTPGGSPTDDEEKPKKRKRRTKKLQRSDELAISEDLEEKRSKFTADMKTAAGDWLADYIGYSAKKSGSFLRSV